MRKSLLLLVVSLLGLCWLPADAQVYRGPGVRWYVPGGVGPAYGYGYGGYGATTPAQGYMQGMSEVIRAQGEANKSTAEARIANEQARSAYIDNQKKWAETYYAKRKMYEQAQDEQRARDREQRDRYLASQRRTAPPRLNRSQFDAVTGFIDWPTTLTGDAYADQRKKVEELLVARKYTGTTDESANELRSLVRSMQAELRGHINDMPANDYLAARRFLEGLYHEGGASA